MKDLYIIGAGGVGGHIAWNLSAYSSKYKLNGFFDDDETKIGTNQFGYKVIGAVKEAQKLENAAVVIGIAFPSIKREIIKYLSQNSSLQFPSFVHEKAWISDNVKIGKGSIIYPGTTINFASDIGDFVVINVNCSLGHHTKIGDYTSLAPGVNTGGHTYIGEGVDVGIGVSTVQDIKIGANSVLGGQSMIIRNVKSDTTVAGVPAKEI